MDLTLSSTNKFLQTGFASQLSARRQVEYSFDISGHILRESVRAGRAKQDRYLFGCIAQLPSTTFLNTLIVV